jgi:DNA-binding Lrp family transcriptional regulator
MLLEPRLLVSDPKLFALTSTMVRFKYSNEGRRSYRSIGLEIGLVPQSIKTRITNMFSSGVIEKFIVIISPSALGYGKECLVVVRKRQEKQNVFKNLSLLGDVILEVQSLGGFSAFRLILKEESEHKIQFLADALKPAEVETMLVTDSYKTKIQLSKTDLSILKYLVLNPRIESSEIAENLSISTKTVTRRLRAMQNSHTLKFSLLLNPASLGGYILFGITMNIKYGSYQKILSKVYLDFREYFLLLPPAMPQGTITVLFLSKDVFTADKILEIIESYKGVNQTEVFLPTKITLRQDWLTTSIDRKLRQAA